MTLNGFAHAQTGGMKTGKTTKMACEIFEIFFFFKVPNHVNKRHTRQYINLISVGELGSTDELHVLS